VTDFLVAALGNTTAALAPVADETSATPEDEATPPMPGEAPPSAASRALGPVRRVPVDRLEELKPALEAHVGRPPPGAACPAARRAQPTAAPRASLPLVVASVNPPALERLRRLAEEVGGLRLLVAREDLPIPLRTDVDEPERVGADRLLAALAAHRRARGPCIILDAGTALTVNGVSAEGVFLGGAIFPGPELAARSLAEGTALLPNVDVWDVERVIGKNTEEAIRAGICHGWRGAATALLAGALAEVGETATIFLTGGGAGAAASEVPILLGHGTGAHEPGGEAKACRTVADLVLEGLVIAYREWHKG